MSVHDDDKQSLFEKAGAFLSANPDFTPERKTRPKRNSARNASKQSEVQAGLQMTCATDVEMKPLRWLWPSRFLIGHINFIAGDPGLGKSLTAVDMAARVSTGRDWPDGTACEQGCVVYATTEDGFADTVKPRLAAANAEMQNIMFLECYRASDSTELPVYLDQHLPLLDEYLTENQTVRLIIFDTLQSFVGEQTNTNNNASCRRIMTPLKRLAETHQVAILCIEHLNKGSTSKHENATYRLQGSIAFAGAARSVWMVAKDKQTPELRYLQATKTNLAPDTAGLGLSYLIEGATGHPVLVWQDTDIATPISELLAIEPSPTGQPTKLEEACSFLRDFLTVRRPPRDVEAAAKEQSIAWATVRRAQKELGIAPKKDGAHWFWELPTPSPQQPAMDYGLDEDARST